MLQLSFPSTIGGLQDFLFQNLSQHPVELLAARFNPNGCPLKQALTVEELEVIRLSLLRGTQPSVDQPDLFMQLSAPSSDSANNRERIGFIEALQKQLKEEGRINFQKAFYEALR